MIQQNRRGSGVSPITNFFQIKQYEKHNTAMDRRCTNSSPHASATLYQRVNDCVTCKHQREAQKTKTLPEGIMTSGWCGVCAPLNVWRNNAHVAARDALVTEKQNSPMESMALSGYPSFDALSRFAQT